MFEGLTTRLSEANYAVQASNTLKPTTDIVRVTDTTSSTSVTTIVPAFAGFSGIIVLMNKTSATMTLATTGNIAGAASATIAAGSFKTLVFSKVEGKWSFNV